MLRRVSCFKKENKEKTKQETISTASCSMQCKRRNVFFIIAVLVASALRAMALARPEPEQAPVPVLETRDGLGSGVRLLVISLNFRNFNDKLILIPDLMFARFFFYYFNRTLVSRPGIPQEPCWPCPKCT